LKDYYKILEINRNSTAIEIKRAYRKLALMYHPDVNSDLQATAIFKDLNEAYRTLGNAAKKRHYDFYYASGKEVKLDDKYKQDNGRKYGTAYKNQHQTNQSRNQYKTQKKEERPDFSKMENWMFGSLVFIGILAIFLSVRDLYNNEIEDINAFTGIIFGLLFTFLLVYSWTQIYRKKNKD
jgi:curved DNA-binding protein CbpA